MKILKKSVMKTYQEISITCELDSIEKELELRRILELREELYHSERNYRNNHGRISYKSLDKVFWDIDDCDLENAIVLIKNRRV